VIFSCIDIRAPSRYQLAETVKIASCPYLQTHCNSVSCAYHHSAAYTDQTRSMRAGQKLNLDTIGVGASTLCLVHCLALPVLIASIPILGSGAASQGCDGTPFDFWIHVGLLAAVVPIGMTAWGLGYRRHKDPGILFLGMVGVAFLVAALMFGHHWMDGQGERVLTIAGSIAMVSAHLLNRRQCRCSKVRYSQEPFTLASSQTRN
jgi:hypothetical protein